MLYATHPPIAPGQYYLVMQQRVEARTRAATVTPMIERFKINEVPCQQADETAY